MFWQSDKIICVFISFSQIFEIFKMFQRNQSLHCIFCSKMTFLQNIIMFDAMTFSSTPIIKPIESRTIFFRINFAPNTVFCAKKLVWNWIEFFCANDKKKHFILCKNNCLWCWIEVPWPCGKLESWSSFQFCKKKVTKFERQLISSPVILLLILIFESTFISK